MRAQEIADVCKPSEAEINMHNLTHLPFRDWCPYCVQGKAVSYPHIKRKQKEDEVPIISSDYMGLKHREPEERIEGRRKNCFIRPMYCLINL